MAKNCTGIAERYAMILNELSSSETVKRSYLQEITGESERVIQMDLNDRLKHVFHIETDNRGNYWMDKKYRGLFTINELKEYAKILGASNLFPEFNNSFLTRLIENKSTNSFIIRSPYKDTIKDSPEFVDIMNAIDDLKGLFFRYNGKSYGVLPYRLLNTYGHWYLCCTDNGVLKTFKFNKLVGVRKNTNKFVMDDLILKQIEESETVWISNSKPIVIKLKINSDFKEYFKENVTLPGETNRTEANDGSLIVDISASVLDEIKSIVKYWIPRIEVLEPKELKEIIKQEIIEYAASIDI